MAADSEAMATPTSRPLDVEGAPFEVVDGEKPTAISPSTEELPSDTSADASPSAAQTAAASEQTTQADLEDTDDQADDPDTAVAKPLTPTPTPPPTSLPPLAPPAPSRQSISARGEGHHQLSEDGRASSTSAMPTSTTGSMAPPASTRGLAGGFTGAGRNRRMQQYIRSNAKINRLVQVALLKTLIHAIRRGSVEGVRVAIERGVLVRYLDSRNRNLIMLATKCDTDARLPIVVILADAGCDVDHADQLGWNCLHYACASGALDVATELVRRGARVEYNPYGYGPEDFVIPKVVKAKSLLQHTEQLQHEKNVKDCWTYFRRQAERSGYTVKCRSHCDLGKPLRVVFQAPAGHSSLDRIRVVDMNSEDALWMQVSKSFTIPPGDVGSITLDSETLDRPSLYRIFYEKYEPTPMRVPQEVAEHAFSIKNLENGTTVSVGSVNELVLKELQSTRAGRNAKHASSSSREAPPESTTKSVRRMSTTRCRNTESEREQSENDVEEAEEETLPNDTITVAKVEEHPAVNSITGVYRVVAMAIVSVSTLNKAKPNEYEITVKKDGAIGLTLEPKIDTSKRTTKLIVRRSAGQAAAVNPGDLLVAIGSANIEFAGLKHTLWELNEAPRPLVLRFRRGTQKEKKSLFTGIRNLAGTKTAATIAL